jgi:hypothetical protein
LRGRISSARSGKSNLVLGDVVDLFETVDAAVAGKLHLPFRVFTEPLPPVSVERAIATVTKNMRKPKFLSRGLRGFRVPVFFQFGAVIAGFAIVRINRVGAGIESTGWGEQGAGFHSSSFIIFRMMYEASTSGHM